jgi:eukaryotic-like serine/threonine-protein kinase
MATVPPWVLSSFPNVQNIAPIRAGGQKTCFSGDHPTDGPVVLKIIHINQDIALTDREILAVDTVQSPRVPVIFEHGTLATPLGNCKWLRERYVPGTSLRDIVTAGPIPFESAVKLTRHILEAVESSETVNIVHRDIKPDNIICDPSGDYWLIDFGIARHLTLSSLTRTGDPWGKLTLGYAPKEQMRNEKPDIDSRSDLVALGVTVVEAFTGVHPFRHPPAVSDLEVVKRVENLVVVSPFTRSPFESEFGDIISAMLQKRRDLRPRSAGEALQWLDETERKYMSPSP